MTRSAHKRFIVLILGIIVGIGVFLAVAEDYITNDALIAFDLRLADVLRASRYQPVLQFYYAITVLINMMTVLGTCVLLTFLLWRQNAKMYLLVLWLALASGTSLMFLAKIAFQRSRPEDFLPIVPESSYSFPSGHATAAVIIFGFLAYMFIRDKRVWIAEAAAIVFAAIMVVLVDASRLYLGVHFVSDVIAGNALGFAVLLGSIAIGEWYQANHEEKLIRIHRSIFLGVILLQCFCLLGFLVFTPLES